MPSHWPLHGHGRSAYVNVDSPFPDDLVARDHIYLNLDHAQHGLGSTSCGPGVLPAHELWAAETDFAVTLIPVRSG